MDETTFATAREMEREALAAEAGGAMVLAPTSRLARRYRHCARMAAIRGAGGRGASWRAPRVSELRAWVRGSFDLLWDGRALPGKAARLRLWHDAATAPGADPPQGLAVTPSLYNRLQEAYETLHEHKLDPEAGVAGGATFAWRAVVVRHFERLSRSRGFLGWHEIVRAVGRAAREGGISLPDRIVVPLPGEPPALLRDLLEALSARSRVSLWRLPAFDGAAPECRVVATSEQECRTACAGAVARWRSSPGAEDLALVALDGQLLPLAARCLEELAGRESTPDGHARYRAGISPPLASHPLFAAATLPLRQHPPDPIGALAHLARSPFAAPDRLRDFESEVLEKLRERDLYPTCREAVSLLARRFPSMAPLAALHAGRRRPLREWTGSLREVWRALGFFRFGGRPEARDACASAEQALLKALEDLESHCGDLQAGLDGASSWLEAACEGLPATAEPGGGGIQVLSAASLFGLPFDGLWVLGVHGGTLPTPARPEPLLAPTERAAVAAGDPLLHSWEEGRRLLGSIAASAGGPSSIAFSRALEGGDGKRPHLPSPFLRDRFAEAGKRTPFVIDLWRDERAAWLAAPWLAGASRGLAHPVDPAPPAPDPTASPLPGEIHVTALGTLLECPFQYFARHHLHLQAPARPEVGLSPSLQGRILHRALERFTALLAPPGIADWPGSSEEAWAALRDIVHEELRRCGDTPFAAAERARLLGDDESGTAGLLRPWIEAEARRARDGWQILEPAAGREHPFSGLRLDSAGLTLKGRADRVDRREDDKALAVWDYKSGDPPKDKQVSEHMTHAQLPAYLLALGAGLLTGETKDPPAKRPVALKAGFIVLKSDIKKIHDERDIGEKLDAWKENAARRTCGPRQGLYPADPIPAPAPKLDKTPCQYCDLTPLCGFFDAPLQGSEEDEE